MTKIKLGNYKHFKGKVYEVVALARHSETLEELAIYKDQADNYWARPKKMFLENIEVNGKKIPRFEFIK